MSNFVRPDHWEVREDGAQWKPVRSVAPVVTVSAVSENEGNVPRLSTWLVRWTDGGRLHLGGWTLRSANGFVEDTTNGSF